METKQVWNGLEIAKLIASLTTPIMVALIGFWLNRRLKKQDDRFAEAQRKLYREDEPHIELTLDCAFHGVRGDKRLTTFTVSAKNVGRVEHKFDQILLRVRGIRDEPFGNDSKNESHIENEKARRALFPEELFKRNLVPKTKNSTWNYIFVEPGVKQAVTFTTVVPADFTYLLAQVWFQYEATRPHTAEAVFAVTQPATG